MRYYKILEYEWIFHFYISNSEEEGGRQTKEKGMDMKQWLFYSIMVLALAFFTGCGSQDGETEEHMHGEEAMESMQQGDSLPSLDEWIRPEPVDVSAVDVNGDGFVYQDPMDWNVIADEEGRCPKCNMLLVQVTIDEAVNNLKENGYTVK
jgi:hypothetical protein